MRWEEIDLAHQIRVDFNPNDGGLSLSLDGNRFKVERLTVKFDGQHATVVAGGKSFKMREAYINMRDSAQIPNKRRRSHGRR